MTKLNIISQDQYFLVINKPPGMVVNQAETVKQETVQDWVEKTQSFPISNNKELRNGIVHRLDKDTSGVMLIAKTKDSLEKLQSLFKNRQVKKTYKALVHGRLQPKVGHISLPLSRTNKDRESFGVSLSGKMSKTSYQVTDHFSDLIDKDLRSKSYQGFSLVELFPKTGRTHQIRVVLKHLGHPIVGDSKYVGKKRIKKDVLWCSRQFLHASEIEFVHPYKNNSVSFKAPLAKDLIQSLDLLE